MCPAVALVIDCAFAERGVACVHRRCTVGNGASRRTAWSLGFRFRPTIPVPAGQPER
jgi:RimJ/RimL family protein N-acetyltransferase